MYNASTVFMMSMLLCVSGDRLSVSLYTLTTADTRTTSERISHCAARVTDVGHNVDISARWCSSNVVDNDALVRSFFDKLRSRFVYSIRC